MHQKNFILSLIFNGLFFLVALFLLAQNRAMLDERDKMVGAFQEYGMTGIYNATPLTVPNETGVALAIDSQGRLIASTSSVITISN